MGITPRGKDHTVRFKKHKKRRVSQTDHGEEAYESSENAIVHVPKSLVHAIAKKVHTQVMGDVLQRMTSNHDKRIRSSCNVLKNWNKNQWRANMIKQLITREWKNTFQTYKRA